jgi:ubiquinone/menaquinone biosynthesis C-methylase UbiE
MEIQRNDIPTKKAEYIYEPFADTVEYRTVNDLIVHEWVETMRKKGVRDVGHLLDVATGVGTMVQLFLENLPKQWKQPLVECLDKSAEALEQVKSRLGPSLSGRLRVIHSSAEEIDLPKSSIDVVVWGNGIHYLDAVEQKRALLAIKRVLKPGGWFFFNSAFYAESREPETLPFYRAQVRKAVQYLRDLGITNREREGRPKAGEFLPKAHYEAMLREAGFSVEDVREVGVRMYRVAWEHISNFQQYAAGALHGYRPDVAAEAMRIAVAQALEEHGQRDESGKPFVMRKWLAVSARVSSIPQPA